MAISVQNLKQLTRRKLQKLAKRENIKANGSTKDIIAHLLKKHDGGDSSLLSSMKRSGSKRKVSRGTWVGLAGDADNKSSRLTDNESTEALSSHSRVGSGKSTKPTSQAVRDPRRSRSASESLGATGEAPQDAAAQLTDENDGQDIRTARVFIGAAGRLASPEPDGDDEEISEAVKAIVKRRAAKGKGRAGLPRPSAPDDGSRTLPDLLSWRASIPSGAESAVIGEEQANLRRETSSGSLIDGRKDPIVMRPSSEQADRIRRALVGMVDETGNLRREMEDVETVMILANEKLDDARDQLREARRVRKVVEEHFFTILKQYDFFPRTRPDQNAEESDEVSLSVHSDEERPAADRQRSEDVDDAWSVDGQPDEAEIAEHGKTEHLEAADDESQEQWEREWMRDWERMMEEQNWGEPLGTAGSPEGSLRRKRSAGDLGEEEDAHQTKKARV